MLPRRSDLLKFGLNALYCTGAHRLLAPAAQGIGIIFTLHHVRPEDGRQFSPNRLLSVTPDFLDAVLSQVKAAGFDVVSLDEAHQRIATGEGRFACFSLDDGYRDNRQHALPIFKRHEAPFTVYVASDFAEGRGELWWLALEEVIASSGQVEVEVGNPRVVLPTGTAQQKQAAFDRVYWWLRSIDEDAQRNVVRDLCERHGVSLTELCRRQVMGWEEMKSFAREPLVTIGAHTAGHFALAKLDAPRARSEMEGGATRIEQELGKRPVHLSYPYGDAGSAGAREFAIAADLGFKTAVTTRKGVVFAEHAKHMTALPRVSLNGEYQSLRFTELYLSGAPFALSNRFRRIDAA